MVDYSEFGKFFGNDELSSDEVLTLIGYTLTFVILSVILLAISKDKVADWLVLFSMFWLVGQHTYHLEHGEQLDQYMGMAFLLLFGLILFIVGWITKHGTPDADQTEYWAGLVFIIGIIAYVFISLDSQSNPLVSDYPDGLSSQEYIIVGVGLLGALLLLLSYINPRK